MELVYFFVGVLVGGGIIFFMLKNRGSSHAGDAYKNVSETLREQLNKLEIQLQSEQKKVLELTRELGSQTTENRNLLEKVTREKEERDQAQQKLTLQFQNLANQILEEKSAKFTLQNKTQIKELLHPLGEKISQFEKKVEETNQQHIERSSALKEQIAGLRQVNIQMSKEAENLTKALKGDSKMQGNWGELILERILERSGLTKDKEYSVQVSSVGEDGKRYQPDIIIHLPDEKSLIIDSKVSLKAYEQYVNADSSEENEEFIKAHIGSMRTHVKGLSGKNYQDMYGVKSLDFVLMFIPVEPAFSLGVQYDERLFQDAYEKNIIPVSPSTLFATLRTVANIWRNEDQNRNAQEIAKKCGDLYNKFVGFTEDLEHIGKHLDMSQRSYDDAINKLKSGRGNLIGRVEKIRELGIRTNKKLSSHWTDESDE